MSSSKQLVSWEEWHCTWAHPNGVALGVYEPCSREFDSFEIACAFAEGLKTNVRVKNVHVRSNVW